MRPHFVSMVALIFFTLSYSLGGHSGELILKTEHWEFICKVEVAVGPESPNVIEKIHEFPGVDSSSGSVVFTGSGRLCYRRSSVVDDCYSDMNDWVCYTNYSEAPEVILIY